MEKGIKSQTKVRAQLIIKKKRRWNTKFILRFQIIPDFTKFSKIPSFVPKRKQHFNDIWKFHTPLRVYLNTAHFAKTENLLLKIL